jgi:hypothetical protein
MVVAYPGAKFTRKKTTPSLFLSQIYGLSMSCLPYISSPSSVSWSALRATEGWAALQHHTLLRTSLTLFPPQDDAHTQQPPHLSVELKQGSFFTILPAFHSMVPQWYPGNVYDMERSVPVTLSLPVPPSTSAPTEYDVFVSGDYEVRLFHHFSVY